MTRQESPITFVDELEANLPYTLNALCLTTGEGSVSQVSSMAFVPPGGGGFASRSR